MNFSEAEFTFKPNKKKVNNPESPEKKPLKFRKNPAKLSANVLKEALRQQDHDIDGIGSEDDNGSGEEKFGVYDYFNYEELKPP
jgi:hypothetical protein